MARDVAMMFAFLVAMHVYGRRGLRRLEQEAGHPLSRYDEPPPPQPKVTQPRRFGEPRPAYQPDYHSAAAKDRGIMDMASIGIIAMVVGAPFVLGYYALGEPAALGSFGPWPLIGLALLAVGPIARRKPEWDLPGAQWPSLAVDLRGTRLGRNIALTVALFVVVLVGAMLAGQ